MKKGFLIVLAIAIVALVPIIIVGCGSSADTSGVATTTLTTAESAVALGKAISLGNSALFNLSNVGIAVSNSSGKANNIGPASLALLKTKTTIDVAPPDSFFDAQSSDWNGYLTVPSLHTGETVTVRFRTLGGEVINGSFFSSPTQKKIADIPGVDWDDLVDPESIFSNSYKIFKIQTWAANSSRTYRNIVSLWDYIMWSSVLSQVRSYTSAIVGLSMPNFSTPASTLPEDLLGGFEGTVTREASPSNYGVNLTFVGTMEYCTSITPPHEVPTTLSGGGTISLPSGMAINLIMNLGFVTNEAGGVIPTTGTMAWKFTASREVWSGTATINGASRTASGTVKRSGIEVGTLYLDALGGAVVTIEGTTYNVTAPL